MMKAKIFKLITIFALCLQLFACATQQSAESEASATDSLVPETPICEESKQQPDHQQDCQKKKENEENDDMKRLR